MERAGINRTELAEAAGVSPAFVSKVLNGSTNYTLKTMAKLARAAGAVLPVRLVDEDREVVRVVSAAEAAWLDSRSPRPDGAESGGRPGPKVEQRRCGDAR